VGTRILAVIFFVVIVLAIAFFARNYYLQRRDFSSTSSNFATGGDYDDSTRKIDRFETTGGYTPLALNVGECQKGRDAVYFGLGHTEFSVKGKQNNKCVFRHGTEIEDPGWNGNLDNECAVPVDESVSLKVGDQGIDFSPIDRYCGAKR